MVTGIALCQYEQCGIGIFSNNELSDLENAVNVVVFSEDSSKFQEILDRLDGSVVMFAMRFVPSKCFKTGLA